MTTASAPEVTEDDLIAGLVAGDSRIYQLAMHRYGGAMLASARAISASHAEDAVQEAWLACMQAIDGFQRRSTLKTWLIGITINRALVHLRKTHRTVSLEGLDDSHDPYGQFFDHAGHWLKPVANWSDDSPEKLLEAHAMRECIDHHLADLPAGQSLALVLTDFQALDVEDVCARLNVTPNHYRVLLHRARMSLFRMLSHFEATGDC